MSDTTYDRLLWRLARDIASVAHYGQVDKCGQPYIKHVLRVADMCAERYDYDPETVQVALLHDVIEDGDIMVGALYGLGFSDRVVGAVSTLTRLPHEEYGEYIYCISNDELARRVKLADLADNMAPHRDFPGREKLMERYRKAKATLEVAAPSEIVN